MVSTIKQNIPWTPVLQNERFRVQKSMGNAAIHPPLGNPWCNLKALRHLCNWFKAACSQLFWLLIVGFLVFMCFFFPINNDRHSIEWVFAEYTLGEAGLTYYRITELNWLFLTSNKISFQGLPWWRSGEESACQCRGHGFEPWSRKIPHATEQLTPRATTTEPLCHNYWSPRA